MWIWFVAAFLLAAIWIGGYFTQLMWPLLEILLSVGVVLFVVIVLVVRRYRAVRAAKALEREILRQAEQQAMNARPDRRAEILELQEQIQKGIASLKTSKLGAATGASALYALPWYVIIGPPGAGKTTALKQSGLEFPFLDPRGGGVKGVGGTRNCDWWFTNEAILLDTAGRYATEKDDHEEWIAFLDMLKKFRSKKPINGVLVAISISDLATATEEQIDTYAKKLRARVDEVMTRLEMVVPVYVMFTKADLVAGFVEFFGDLRKSERGTIWGATFPLDQTGKPEPAKAMEEEFDVLVKTLHARALRRIGSERNTEARQKIFQFPLEFQSLKNNLTEFIGALFEKNTFQDTPIFRGIYFSSGTQEGRPMDRVLGSMARAFGLRPQALEAAEQPKESKSYFVTDLFKRVVFPDQNVAARTAREMRRQRLRRLAYGLAAIAFAMLLIVPSSCTFSRNSTLVDQTEKVAKDGGKVKWNDGGAIIDKAKTLDPMLDQVKKLSDWQKNGAPIGMRWGMYVGDKIYPALRDAYVASLKTGFADPSKAELEARLGSVDSSAVKQAKAYNTTYDDLKTYLMLTEKEHLDIEWASPRLQRVWAAAMHTNFTPEIEKELKPHVDFYLELLKSGEIEPWKQNKDMVARDRSALLQVPQLDREYEDLVREANFKVDPITLDSIFYGPIADWIKGKKKVQVEGAYTRLGYGYVRGLLDETQGKLAAERWVLGESQIQSFVETKKQIERLREKYFLKYKEAWKNFLEDIDVTKPDSTDKSLTEMQLLSEPEWPYLRLLRTLDDNVRLDVSVVEAEGVGKDLIDKGVDYGKRKLNEKGIDAGAPEAKVAAVRPMSPVEKAFKPMTKFAVPDSPPKEGEAGPPTQLSQYQAQLGKLVGLLSLVKDGDTPPDPKKLASEYETSYRAVQELLGSQDGFTAPLLSPLLLRPITLGWTAVLKDVHGAAGGLWEVNVWQKWQKTLEGKYPFNPLSQTDSSIQDYNDFFKPKEGHLWAFYEQFLKGSLEERGGEFVPAKSMTAKGAWTGPFLTCLKRGLEITKGTFPPKAEGAIVSIDINLHSVSEDVSEVTFDIDGKTKTYKNTPEEWLTIDWPAKDAEQRGAKVRVRGYAGLDEEINRSGDFGLFRLLDAASDIRPGTAAGKPGEKPTMVATWDLRTQKGAFIKVDIRPTRGDNPFKAGFYKAYTCPRVIVAH